MNYKRAKSYAYKLDTNNYRDLVHNAYIQHYDRTGKNLFDESDYYVMRLIKWVRNDEYRKFSTVTKYQETDGKYEVVDRYQRWHELPELASNDAPDLAIEAEETYQSIIDKIQKYNILFDTRENLSNSVDVEAIRQRMLQILTYKLAGYKNTEIASLMNLSSQVVGYYARKIKTL